MGESSERALREIREGFGVAESRESTLDDVREAVLALGAAQAAPFQYVEVLGFLRGRGLQPSGVSVWLDKLDYGEKLVERLDAATGERWRGYGEDEGGPMLIRVLSPNVCPPHDYKDISDGANLINVSQCERCGVITKTVPGEPIQDEEAAG